MSLLSSWIENDMPATVPAPAVPAKPRKASANRKSAPAKAAPAPAPAPSNVLTFTGQHARAIGNAPLEALEAHTVRAIAAAPKPKAQPPLPPVTAANGLTAHAMENGLFWIVDPEGLPVAFMRQTSSGEWRKVDLDPAIWSDFKALTLKSFVANYL